MGLWLWITFFCIQNTFYIVYMNKRDYTLYNWPKEMVRNGEEPEELHCFNICDTTYSVT